MKKKAILILTAILALVVIAGISVSAQGGGWEYYACGTIDGYEAVESAEINPPGFWNLKVQGKQIWLDVYNLETNLDADIEGSPEGSIDIFEYSMTGKPMVFSEDEGKLEIFAVMRVTKTWAQFDGTYKSASWKTWLWFTFDFDAGTVHIDGWPGEEEEGDILGTYDPENPDTWDWDRYGTITAYDYTGPS